MVKFALALMAVIAAVVIALLFIFPVVAYPVSGKVFVCSPAHDEYGPVISGIPISGVVLVFVKGGVSVSSAPTGLAGEFSIILETGTYIVHAERVGYISGPAQTLLVDGQKSNYNEVCMVASSTVGN